MIYQNSSPALMYQELKVECQKYAGSLCIKPNFRNRRSSYTAFCEESQCTFQIQYNYRSSSAYPTGYYLYKACLTHKQDCPNAITNNDTTDPHYIAKRISRLFRGRAPTIEEIRNAIQYFNNSEFSHNQLKYIKQLARLNYLQNVTDPIEQCIDFCKTLANIHGWTYDIKLEKGLIVAITLFPPWAESLIRNYHSPLIVDATFTQEDLRFIIATVVDGENTTRILSFQSQRKMQQKDIKTFWRNLKIRIRKMKSSTKLLIISKQRN